MTAQKKELRKKMHDIVKSLPAIYCIQADTAIFSNIRNMKEYKEARTVFCFVGMQDEVKTWSFIDTMLAAGKHVGVPLCVDKGIMEVRLIHSRDDLQKGFYGLLEPKADTPVIDPEDIDLIIVPGAAGDKKGHRLGYGGGYYDRYLKRCKAPKVMVCREKCIREDIPVEPHDVIMDAIATETGIYRVQ